MQRDTTGQQAALLLGGTETAETVTPDAGRTATKRLIEEQVGRVWAELSSKALKVRSKTVGVVLARTLGGLITVDEGKSFVSSHPSSCYAHRGAYSSLHFIIFIVQIYSKRRGRSCRKL